MLSELVLVRAQTRNLVFVIPKKLGADEILRAVVGQNWPLPGRKVSGPNCEFDADPKWQGETLHPPRRPAAIACKQRVLGNGGDGSANKPVEVAVLVDFELIGADVEAVTVRRQNEESPGSRGPC